MLFRSPNFSAENQRNYQWISLGDSLDIKRLAYYHNTSTSITSPNVSSNVSYTSTTVNGQSNGLIIFTPFNANKASTFDRCAIYFQVDQPQQLNTSLSQYFTNANITSTTDTASLTTGALVVAGGVAVGGKLRANLGLYTDNLYYANGSPYTTNSGTVNSGTATRLAYYVSTGTALSQTTTALTFNSGTGTLNAAIMEIGRAHV